MTAMMTASPHTPAVAAERTSSLARAGLLQKLGGYVNTQLIYIIAKLGLADILQDGAKPSHELAALLGVQEQSLHRILRGCVCYGLLAQDAEGRFALTPLSIPLQTNGLDSLRDLAILTGEEWYSAWGKIYEVLDSDAIPFVAAHGQEYYTYLTQKPAAGKRFNKFMQARTIQASQALIGFYDFSRHEVVVDIGGGNGTLLQAILSANPHLQGILYDAPAAVVEAEARRQTQDLSERCKTIGGDFFSAVPSGGDLYILSQVLHNWSDGQCLQILGNCRDSIKQGGTLLLLEQVIPVDVKANLPAVEMDLMMLALSKGRERTAAAYGDLLATAGFTLLRLEQAKRFGLTLLEAKISF